MTGLLIAWLLLCAGADLRWRKLPNVLTLGAYLPAVLILVFAQQSLLGAGVGEAILGWLLAIVLTLPAYALRQLGAGDVKMLTALALMSDWQFLIFSFAVAGLLAGSTVLIWLLLQRYLPYMNLKLARFGQQLPAMPVLQGRKLPFGAMIALGGLLSCWMLS